VLFVVVPLTGIGLNVSDTSMQIDVKFWMSWTLLIQATSSTLKWMHLTHLAMLRQK